MEPTERMRTRRSPLAEIPVSSPMLSAPQPWGLAVVPGPSVEGTAADTVLPLGPSRWLAVHEERPGGLSSVVDAHGGTSAAVDVSHAMTRVRVSGIGSRSLLAAGITIDLHPEAFTAGDAAVTTYREVSVVLFARGEDTFDLYTPRSLAASLWQWLADAAAGTE